MKIASDRKRFYADLMERAFWTFVQAFLGIWSVAGFDFNYDILKSAAVAAVIAAIKAQIVGRTVGNEGTASTLPEGLDPATPPPVAVDQ